MGVDLGGLFPAQPTSVEGLAGKTLAVDAYNTLYQFLAIIRGPDGTPLKDDQGRVTSHLNGLLNRTANLAAAGIATVFVFDGAPHPLKAGVLQARTEVRAKAMVDYEDALREGDLERARSKAQQTATLSKEMVEQAKRLLRAFGMPIVQAPSEGEAQASHMARQGLVYATASQDFDSLLFGAPHLVRNLTVTGRRKQPGRQAWSDVTPEDIDLAAGLSAIKLTLDQAIDIAILIGTDYNAGIAGVGPKTALKLIQQYGTLEALIEQAPKQTGNYWLKLANQEGIADYAMVRDLFRNPPIEPAVGLQWGRLDRNAVLDLLVGEHHFSKERVESALERLASAPFYRKQKSLVDWS